MKLFFLIAAVVAICVCGFELFNLWRTDGWVILLAMSDTAIILLAGKAIDYIWANR